MHDAKNSSMSAGWYFLGRRCEDMTDRTRREDAKEDVSFRRSRLPKVQTLLILAVIDRRLDSASQTLRYNITHLLCGPWAQTASTPEAEWPTLEDRPWVPGVSGCGFIGQRRNLEDSGIRTNEHVLADFETAINLCRHRHAPKGCRPGATVPKKRREPFRKRCAGCTRHSVSHKLAPPLSTSN